MPDIRLITRGDDAGSCVSANLALVECARAGVLKNIGVMVPGPAFEHAVPLLKELDGVALGLHVTLNAEWDAVRWGPVLGAGKVPSLVREDGTFTHFPKDLHERGFDVMQAVAEVQAQLDLGRARGLEFRYLDEHMGLSWIGLREPLARLAEREGLVDHAGFDYWDGEQTVPALEAKLKVTAPGTYVIVNHPGADAEDMRAFMHPGLEPGQIAREREQDRRFWTDLALAELVTRGLFKPIRYDEAQA